jgi:uncharacterized membrane protein YoaT (DUF817 family)
MYVSYSFPSECFILLRLEDRLLHKGSCLQTWVLSLWGFLLDARNIKWSPFSVLPTTAIVVVICVHFSTHSIMFNFCFLACCMKLIWLHRLLIYSKGHCERSMFFLLNAVLGGRVEEAILLNSIILLFFGRKYGLYSGSGWQYGSHLHPGTVFVQR